MRNQCNSTPAVTVRGINYIRRILTETIARIEVDMKLPGRISIAALSLLGAFLTVSPGIAQAGNEVRTGAPGSQEGKHCKTTVARAEPGEEHSKVLSRTCADSQADLRIQEASLLLIVYVDIGYSGESEVIEGDSGPCDIAGYAIPKFGKADQVSSFKTFNNCNQVRGYRFDDLDGGYYYYEGSQWYVGDNANDNIRSFKVNAIP